jgi:FkbM family methyltransferase
MYQSVLPNLYSKRYIDDGNLTFSRDKQDRYAIDTIFCRKRNGYFLDIGASDGITENNTILMERYYDWEGICFEPDPRDIQRLRSERNCTIVNSPVYNSTGEIVNFELHNFNHLSSIQGYQTDKYRSQSGNIVCLATVSLMDCLDKFGAPHTIDYMSLDTEGSEYEILSTFDFNKYTVKYIALEHNFQEPKRTKIKQLLEGNGYILHRSHTCDDDYLLVKSQR